ncbi:MAG: AbrB/MazE/SpoVT family DNA-binding domain-containing protein [Nitrososphaerota archaeon]|nr:AbrB/MazE/SpoVT family DNA-binding domain-containing protein [Nitrososphaerota archaeon]
MEAERVVKALTKGQMVIPKEARDRFGIVPGRELLVAVVDEQILEPALGKEGGDGPGRGRAEPGAKKESGFDFHVVACVHPPPPALQRLADGRCGVQVVLIRPVQGAVQCSCV